MRALVMAVACALSAALLPQLAAAHDDPVVTVRVMCDGFNVLDMDAVLGEISNTATLSVDRPVHGADEIEAWVKDQMDHDLRIEIVDMGVPQQLADGYTLTWTARFSRQDWRQAGVAARQAHNSVTIHNGRITDWTASLAVAAASDDQTRATANERSAAPQTAPASRIPELLGIPMTLYIAAGIVVAGGWLAVRKLLR